MSLERLWAGWRSTYVSSASVAGRDVAGQIQCVFCAIAERLESGSASEEELYVVWTGETCMVVLNLYPYASGHLLVMPRRHAGSLQDLSPAESTELWKASLDALSALERSYGPDGLNLGANLGRAAGAGLPDHVHLHALPRWVGDTNFMTAVAEVRVMPETLPESWKRLRAAWPGS